MTASEAQFKTPRTAMQAAPHHQHAQVPFNETTQAVNRATGLLGANRAMEDVRPFQREECSVARARGNCLLRAIPRVPKSTALYLSRRF